MTAWSSVSRGTEPIEEDARTGRVRWKDERDSRKRDLLRTQAEQGGTLESELWHPEDCPYRLKLLFPAWRLLGSRAGSGGSRSGWVPAIPASPGDRSPHAENCALKLENISCLRILHQDWGQGVG